MTVEELEIVITTNIQKAMPNIRKVVKEVKNAVNETKGLNSDVFKGIDMGKVASGVSKATNTAIKETKKMKEQLKSLGMKDAGDTTGLKIQGIVREITGISDKFKELKGQRGVLGDVLEAQKFKQQAEEMKRVINNIGGAGYKKYDTQSIQNAIENFKGGNIKKTVVQADTKKAEIDVDKLNSKLNNINGKKITANVKTNASSELNKSNSFANRLKNAMQQVKKQMDSSGSSSKKISNGLSSALGSINKISGPLKVGLGQILKIAGALFSLRSIYSVLSNSARAWLSSQNAQAQQLSANIEYMKYALGSVLAPAIEWIVNLIYQALKGVQALIYALTGVNIFANASAKAYSSMAGSAKKAKDETKQLAGIHNEINNIQDNQGSDSGGGGGATPNFDLGNLDGKFSAFAEKVKTVLSKLFEPMKNAWDTYGQGVIESIKTSAIQVKGLFEAVGKSFNEVWLNSTGEKTCGLILQILTSIIQIVGLIAEKWKNAWENNNNGTKIIQNLANALNNILEVALGIANTFKEWWKTEQAQTFINSIVGYFKIFSERVEKATEILKNLWENGGKEAFTNLLNVIGKLAELWTALNEVVEPFVLTLMEELEPTLKIVVDWINKVLEALGGLLDFLIGIFTGDWERAWSGLGTYVGSAIQAVLTLLAGLFEFIVGLPFRLLVRLGEKITEMAEELAKQIKGFFTEKIQEAGGNVAEGLWNGIIEGLGNIAQWILDNIVNPFLDGFKKAMGINSPSTVMFELGKFVMEGLLNGITSLRDKVFEIWENIKNKTREKFTEIKEAVVNKVTELKEKASDKVRDLKEKAIDSFSNIKTKAMEIWSNIKQSITDKVDEIKNGIRDKFQEAYNNIKGIFENVGSFFEGIWHNIESTFSTLGTNIANAISDSVRTGLNGVISMIESTINRAIRIINGAIGLINNLPILNWNLGTIPTLDLPRLAKGGVLYDETMFIGGEYSGARSNPEIVTPQSLMYSTMLKALRDSDLSGNNNDRPLQITVKVGESKLGQILLNDLRNMKRASGKDIEALVGG